MNLCDRLKNQARETMIIAGTSLTVILIMRMFGFNDHFIMKDRYALSWIIGIFIGLVIKSYYGDDT